MNSELLKRLDAVGVDVNQTLERFMNNEAIYEKFLKKFPADTNYSQLAESIRLKEYEEALKYAHTLKGVSGNLGLSGIFAITEKMVAKFRNNDVSGIDDDFEALKKRYCEICSIIAEESI